MKQKSGSCSRTREIAAGQKECRLPAPGSFEDFRQQQHCHVATHAVALARNLLEFPHHRFVRRGMAIVDLHRIRPAGKVRIAPVGQNQITVFSFDPEIVLRLPRQQFLGAGNKIVRDAPRPRGDPAPYGLGQNRASTSARALVAAGASVPVRPCRPSRGAPHSLGWRNRNRRHPHP